MVRCIYIFFFLIGRCVHILANEVVPNGVWLKQIKPCLKKKKTYLVVW